MARRAFRPGGGRWANLTGQDIGDATKRLYDGIQVGLYREGDDLYPILLRNVEPERRSAADRLDVLQIQGPVSTQSIPLAQVTDGVRLAWEDPIIQRYNRRRAVTVQASVSQARPIMLAAGTTVLGVAPLFPDPFWNAMATTIMAAWG